ncbi:hypothetical protein MAR_027406 [Mya arenaria]|uniref:Uncharacterized protein n=1 Tax=Mya arenaria TaxID=6604 RepID=A0ABY7F1J3_MYAAR|nr:hypothetical protein MAR_027406 [Mya arenaria]
MGFIKCLTVPGETLDRDISKRRLRALRLLRVLSAVHGVTCTLLLITAVTSRLLHGPVNNGVPPYYVGAFISLSLVHVYSILLLVILVLCVVSFIITGVTGICAASECSYMEEPATNRALAATSLVFITACVITSAISLAVVCVYSNSFGVRLFTRGQFQVSVINPAQDAYVAGADEPTVTPVVPLKPSTSAHHAHSHTHPDPRLASPPRDFATQHLQHYLTHQYKERIRKRRKRNKRRQHEPQAHTEQTDDHVASYFNIHSHRQAERKASYVLPPIAGRASVPRTPLRDISPSSPPESPPSVSHALFPPPSSSNVGSAPPPPPPSTTPPSTPTTAEYTHAMFPMSSTPPPPSNSPPSAAVSNSPPDSITPPPLPPNLVHVIPYGGFLDDEEGPPPYYFE